MSLSFFISLWRRTPYKGMIVGMGTQCYFNKTNIGFSGWISIFLSDFDKTLWLLLFDHNLLIQKAGIPQSEEKTYFTVKPERISIPHTQISNAVAGVMVIVVAASAMKP